MKVQIKNIKYYVNKEKKTTVCTAKVFVIFSNQDCINYILAKRIRKKSGKTPVFTVAAKCKCHNDDTFDEVIGKRIAESKLKLKAFRTACTINLCMVKVLSEMCNEATTQHFRFKRIIEVEKAHLERISE